MALSLNLSKPLAIVGVVVGAIVAITLMAAFLPTLLGSSENITTALDSGTTGNAQADAIKDIFVFIVPLALILGIVGLVLAVVSFGKK